jgi:hypothetical protein
MLAISGPFRQEKMRENISYVLGGNVVILENPVSGIMKEIKEIIDIGRRLDELTYEVYSSFAKREDFAPPLVALWTGMAEWKKSHIKHWKKISKSFVYKNILKKKPADLALIIKQLKNIQAELVEFLRRLRKKKVSQNEAVSQTVLNEFCLISDIFLEIFYTYGQTLEDRSVNMVEDCQAHLVEMAGVLKPYLRLNPLYSALAKSVAEMQGKHDYLVHHYGKKRKVAS